MLRMDRVTKYYVRSTDKFVLVVWNQVESDIAYASKGEENGVYLAFSNNKGQTFSSPYKVISPKGRLKDIQVIARDSYIVITIVENVDGDDWIRAATGIVLDGMTCEFKPCEKVRVEGEFINAYTFFTEDASADHIYYRKTLEDGSSQLDDSLEIYRREVRHRAKLSLFGSEKV